MIASVLKKDYQNEIKFSLINFTLLCYLFRSAIPAFKYPFMLAYLSLIIYSVAYHRGEILSTLRFVFHTYIIIIILAAILVFSFCLSNKIYLIIFKDIANAFVLLSIFFLMNLLIITKEELKTLILNLIILIVVFASIISIFKLGELLNIFSDNKGVALSNGSNVLQNSYLEQDNNFGILPVIFGIIGLTYLRICTQSRARKLSYDLLLTFFTVSIFFSGSRRGIIILFLFIGLLVLTQIVKLIIKNKNIVSLPPRLTLFILFTFLFLFLMTLFTSYSFKNKTLGLIGSKNVSLTKENIAAVLFKYNMIIDGKKTYLDLFNKIWDVVPGDPESGWGTHTHKTIFPLAGRNVEIVPANSKGYMMDSTCESIQKNGNAYSFTQIASKNVNIKDTISASVYCYVSEDFNGEWASLSSEGSVQAETAKFYDLGAKGNMAEIVFQSELF